MPVTSKVLTTKLRVTYADKTSATFNEVLHDVQANRLDSILMALETLQ